MRAGLLLDEGNGETKVCTARLWRGDGIAQDNNGMLDAEAPAGACPDDEEALDGISVNLRGCSCLGVVRVCV